MYKTLEVGLQGGIGTLWLNRPEKLNALSQQTLRELTDAARWFNEQSETRVVIVGGRGKAFSSGADLSEFPVVTERGARDAADLGRVMAEAIENMTAMTIARLHGWCVGGGLVLAAACDLRIAADTTLFSIPEIDLGIPLAWGGIPRLVREIGPALTKELVATCRQFDSQEALSAGFLNRVVKLDELEKAVQQLALQIAAKPANPVAVTKRHVNAVTSQMTGTMRSWSDADSLLASMIDPECQSAREAYLVSRRRP
ncbi:MAG: enoyl-CoA hydratase/isomerase family protein [Proteobacteria bacterium]|nr:enoyl-CoA hydratase/isomerase family protein [Pseudomonadota bacterium]